MPAVDRPLFLNDRIVIRDDLPAEVFPDPGGREAAAFLKWFSFVGAGHVVPAGLDGCGITGDPDLFI